jgi:5-oxoprolinase (ATP-hydrolysing)
MRPDAKTQTAARLAVDIGGTFTDVVLELPAGERLSTKVLTTYDHPGRAVLGGIDQVLQQAGITPSQVGLVIHGTTLATNALIERRGARTALLTTAGHRDALEMAHEDRFEQYDIMIDRPAPLVPRYLRLPVTERLDAAGKVLRPLDLASLEAALPILDADQVESVAIGYLHAFVNPQHEQQTAEWLARKRPGLSITLASEVCPEIREYERLSTACANAYVQPLMARYLRRLAEELQQRGLHCPFLLMTSGGGLTTLDTAAKFPIRLVESGPAGGAILAQAIAREAGLNRLLSFDMGGTTAKLCLLDDGQALGSRSFEVDRVYRFKKGSGLPVRIPVIEMVEIGAGGGSIASVDKLGRITVGPESAGSEPGPAAYGRGGVRPTVTDADICLGRVHTPSFAGGGFRLDVAAAKKSLRESLGATLAMDSTQAAIGLAEVVEENMAAAARAHAAEFGLDVSSRAMVAFGGAAPLHATRLGEKLGVQQIIIPAQAGVGSAVGFLLAPVAFEVVRSRHQLLARLDSETVNGLYEEMRQEAAAVIAQGASNSAPGAAPLETRTAYMRYLGQGHEIPVRLPVARCDPASAAAYQSAFEDAYRKLYGRCMEGVGIEVLSWTLTLAAPEESSPRPGLDTASGIGIGAAGDVAVTGVHPTPMPIGEQDLFEAGQDGPVRAPVYRREQLAPGSSVTGPALITEDQTTTVVGSAWQAMINGRGHIVLTQCIADAVPQSRERGSLPQPQSGSAVGGSHAADKGQSRGQSPLLQYQLGWSRLLAIVEEQAQTLIRTAFSTTVREAGDLSAGVFDAHGRMLAQAITGTPGHVNAMAASVGFFLQKYPLATLQPGDVLVTNDPWQGTGHLNDFTVVTPVFHQDRAVALFASTSHIADVGGLGFGADGRQVFEEGLNIPIGYLFRQGEPNHTLLEILRANVRDPLAAEGDLNSLAACNQAGARRLCETLQEFGFDDLEALGDHIIRQSRDAMLEEIRRLPTGSWNYAMRVDGYDQPVDLCGQVTIHHDGIEVDFAGSSAQSPRGINVPLTYTQAYASFGVRCVIGNDIPNNAGSLGVVQVKAPGGCILNAPRPAAVSARHAIGQMLPDVVLGCLEQPLRGNVPAEGASCLFGPVFLGGKGVIAGSENPPFVINAFYAGGSGGRPGKDGLSSTAFPSGVRSTPVEITENAAPLLIWRKEYRPGSGGAGACRGGLGQVLEFAHAGGEAFAVSKMFDRIHHPPRGRQGGGSGAAAQVYELTADGSRKPLRGMGRETIAAGARMVLKTAGGGGLGAPGLRDKADIAKDQLNQLLAEGGVEEV